MKYNFKEQDLTHIEIDKNFQTQFLFIVNHESASK